MTATTRRKPTLAKPFLIMGGGTLLFLAVIGALGWALTVLAES